MTFKLDVLVTVRTVGGKVSTLNNMKPRHVPVESIQDTRLETTEWPPTEPSM